MFYVVFIHQEYGRMAEFKNQADAYSFMDWFNEEAKKVGGPNKNCLVACYECKKGQMKWVEAPQIGAKTIKIEKGGDLRGSLFQG